MKACYILKGGLVPRFKDYLYVRISEATFSDVYYQYKNLTAPLCLVVSLDVPLAGLLKFVEGYGGDLAVVVYRTPDLVFLSRFTSVKVTLSPEIKPMVRSKDAELLEECQKLCRSK